MSPRERLASILAEQEIRAFPQHYGGHPVVCFSEGGENLDHARFLVERCNVQPWGVGFKREQLARYGAGPVISLTSNADDALIPLLAASGNAHGVDTLRAFCSLYAPNPQPPNFNVSDWLWYREWRLTVPRDEGPHSAWAIPPNNTPIVVIVGDPDWIPSNSGAINSSSLWDRATVVSWNATIQSFDPVKEAS